MIVTNMTNLQVFSLFHITLLIKLVCMHAFYPLNRHLLLPYFVYAFKGKMLYTNHVAPKHKEALVYVCYYSPQSMNNM